MKSITKANLYTLAAAISLSLNTVAWAGATHSQSSTNSSTSSFTNLSATLTDAVGDTGTVFFSVNTSGAGVIQGRLQIFGGLINF